MGGKAAERRLVPVWVALAGAFTVAMAVATGA